MTMSRRKFIAIAGGGVVVSAGASFGGFVSTRAPRTALEPWSLAGSAYTEPRRRALSYAILAPNPHNRQPWIVDLDVPDEVRLFADTTRLLEETDPFNRQITIGLGCFLELMVEAAQEDGYRVDLELFPDGYDESALDGRLVAIARFEKAEGIVPDPLFANVMNRRSLKEPYDLSKPVGDETLTRLESAVSEPIMVATTNDTARVESLRTLTWDAWNREYTTPAKIQESIDVMRFGKKEIDANPDGIDMGGAFLETLILLGIITKESLADASSTTYQQGLDMYSDICLTAQAYLWLKTSGNTRIDQIEVGRAWARVNLAATGLGLGIHPLSQTLQEFPEMKEFYDEAHASLADEGETVQMLGRLGYAAAVPPSPRWPIDAKIRRT